MTGPGRNDPCPCGSGKKYKKCCLERESGARRESSRPVPSGTSARTAFQWLDRHYLKEVEAAVERFFTLAGGAAPDNMKALSEGALQMAEVNAYEWLLADGSLVLPAREAPVRELLLGPGGPRFSAEDRAWMEAIAARPLGLYEVADTVPGERFEVRDLLHPAEPRVWIEDRSAASTVVRWDVLGARLVPWEGGWRLSGAIYQFVREADLPAFVRVIREELDAEAGGDPELERALLSILIPEEWLREILEPPGEMPALVDVSTGDPILLVTDHYWVRSWERLEAALADREDVEGDREDGWSRFEPLDDDSRRTLLVLDPGRGDRLAVFATTRRRADEGRGWLEAVAGDAVEHRTRELSDPEGVLPGADGPGRSRGRPAREPGGHKPPILVPRELLEKILRKQFEPWADDEIPALGGKTPREAVRTPEGREAVIGLLKLYEHDEERAARGESRDPVSLQFLWDAVGLDREAELR